MALKRERVCTICGNEYETLVQLAKVVIRFVISNVLFLVCVRVIVDVLLCCFVVCDNPNQRQTI